MLEQLHSRCNQAWFAFREKIWGNWIFRRGAFVPPSSAREIALYRWILERSLDEEIRRSATRVVDVGCRDWSYAPALAQVFPQAALTGIEVDGRRRYWNLRRRMDLAQAHADALGKQSRCLFKDFRAVKEGELAGEEGLTVFCFLFPFVSENPCLKAGLPAPYSRFEELLQHAKELSRGRTIFVSLHQGEWERDASKTAFEKLSLESKSLELSVEEISQISSFPYDLHVFVSES